MGMNPFARVSGSNTKTKPVGFIRGISGHACGILNVEKAPKGAEHIPGEPIPHRFYLKRLYHRGEFTLVEVNYPDCRNYEGMKILLLKMGRTELLALRELDPHFMNDRKNALVARFEPTLDGWANGLALIESLNKHQEIT